MADSFDTATARSPASIGPVKITLAVTGGDPNTYVAGYHFQVFDADGEPMGDRQGNLVPHLTDSQKTALRGFLDDMLLKAEGTIT